MNHGVLLMTQKANTRVRFEFAFGHPRQSNFASKSRASKPCQWLFLILKGSSIKNFSQLGKQLVNANLCKDVLDRLIKRIKHIRPDLSASGDWFLQHDNASAYNTASVRQFLAKKILQSFITLPIRRIWLRPIISYSRN